VSAIEQAELRVAHAEEGLGDDDLHAPSVDVLDEDLVSRRERELLIAIDHSVRADLGFKLRKRSTLTASRAAIALNVPFGRTGIIAVRRVGRVFGVSSSPEQRIATGARRRGRDHHRPPRGDSARLDAELRVGSDGEPAARQQRQLCDERRAALMKAEAALVELKFCPIGPIDRMW
jgi:hypothetical protein